MLLELSTINNSLYWDVLPSNINSTAITSQNNAPLTYYSDTIYQRQQVFAQVYKWAEVASYIVLLTGIFCDKVIGVELLGLWQTLFFTLATIDKVQPLLWPMLSLKTVNGINTFMESNNTELPERVRAIGYSR